jgi:tRNA 2-thiouridine synthesizing protein B
MSTLHILASSSDQALQDCLRLLGDGDGVILLGDGVLHASKGAKHLTNGVNSVYCLDEDLAARGLQERCPQQFSRCDMNAFVALCVRFDNSISWY